MDTATIPAPRQKARRAGAPLALDVTLRALAASVGAYGVSSLLVIALSRVLPLAKSEAVTTAMLVGILACCVLALWAFAARTTLRAYLGLGAVALVLTATLAASYLLAPAP